MVITIEPGIYFIDSLINKFLKSKYKKYINESLLKEYIYIGGMRIEDNIIVKTDGYEII
jgi:Xaa-Pro aminopeptidase